MITVEKKIRPEDSDFVVWVWGNMIPDTFECLDKVMELRDQYQREKETIQAQITAYKDYSEVCKYGIDFDQVKSMCNAKSARTVACSILNEVIKKERRIARRPLDEVLAKTEESINRLHSKAHATIQKLDAHVENQSSLSRIEALQSKFKKQSQRLEWVNTKIERLCWELSHGNAAEVQQILWYWANKSDEMGRESFDEFLERESQSGQPQKRKALKRPSQAK